MNQGEMVFSPPLSADSLSFHFHQHLLNAKFESYKLDSSPIHDLTSTVPLRFTPFNQTGVSDPTRLGYAEVQARLHHNHLVPGFAGELLYIDAELGVVILTRTKDGEINAQKVLDLPIPIASREVATAEFPTAISIAKNVWAISDGQGHLYMITIINKEEYALTTASIAYSYALQLGGTLTPFRLHEIATNDDGESVALLSVFTRTSSAGDTNIGDASIMKVTKSTSKTVFDYFGVSLHPHIKESGSTSTDTLQGVSHDLVPLWNFRSDSLPTFVKYMAETQRFMIASSSPLYNPLKIRNGLSPLEKKQKQPESPLMEIKEKGAENSVPSPKPPPYSWYQDKDSVTVVFAIPSDLPTSSIRVVFARRYLSLAVGSITSAAASQGDDASNKVSHKRLWDDILPHLSVWTFDRDGENDDSTYGLLSLHIEKAHPGTKWSDLFAPTPADVALSETERELESVAETIDPSELSNISEAMQKWTEGSHSGLGDVNEVGNTIPSSLTGEEIDVEVDSDTGNPIVITWIKNIFEDSPSLLVPHESIPYSLLSTPLPLANLDTSLQVKPGYSIVIKHDVDGTLFSPPLEPDSYMWEHISTFPALAFVLATKRDAHFVYHLADKAMLAFNSPAFMPGTYAIGDSRRPYTSGNLFTYFTPALSSRIGRQTVSSIGGASSGPLLGVSGFHTEPNRVTVVALLENQLTTFDVTIS